MNDCVAADDGHIEHTELNFIIKIKCDLLTCVLLVIMRLLYNVPHLPATSGLFNPVLGFKNIHFKFFNKAIFDAKHHFILNWGHFMAL